MLEAKSIYGLIEDMPDEGFELTEPIEELNEEATDQPEEHDADAPLFDYTVVGEEWAPPTNFSTTDDELNWYRNQYGKIVTTLSSDEFKQNLLERYQSVLGSEIEDSESFVEHYKGFKANPKEYIRQYFPEKMAELGIDPIMSEDEIETKITARMKEEFGEHYESLLSPMEAVKPKSFTYKALKRQEQLLKEYEQSNEETKNKYKGYHSSIKPQQQEQPVDESAIIEEQYNLYFKDWKRSDYDDFIEKAKIKQWNLHDMEKVINFDVYLETAKAEGKKLALEQISKQSNGVRVTPDDKKENLKQANQKFKEPASIYELMMRG
jgi:hypothetical protein